ncbi:Protein of uncharacterised function (DUF3298) [Phocoenobacter uteri]|uniref:Protein of uncharacterized function (DUF3298) n=1 Tax=Phocoenobacter uteri TaxID=146806 RepID=A0A379C8B4_9PAST|nr:RsiV family protein [Phocoenobacter uteri]MDG6882294.1 hypothetical protein [Phocoenobacter uteri]SUB58451.1 Protein of uncharacterised function (DUF3298) [Phocoenobacter uteri]
MKKLFLSSLIMSTLLLVGCNDDKAEQKIQQLEAQVKQLTQEQMVKVEDKVVLFQKQDETYPVEFSITTLKTNKEWLNSLLVEQLLVKQMESKQELKIENPKAELIKIMEQKYQNEMNEAKELFADQPKEKISGTYFSAVDHTNMDYVGQKENIATFTQSYYSYIGGAHGMYHTNYINVDLNKQKMLTLDDLFSQENQAKLKEMLWQRYEPQYNSADGNMGFFFKSKQKLYLPADFYFSAVGINFVYPVYEIGAYADGQKELMLYWQEIEELIKPEYRFSKPVISE